MIAQMIFLAVTYMGILILFAWYSFLNVKQTKTIEEWNDKTDIEISALKERNLDLEKRLAKLEKDLNGSIIESEPDLEVK